MKVLFVFTVIIGFFAGTQLVSAADITVCKSGSLERRVEVSFTNAEAKVPCEVKYFKEGNAEGKVLWSAQNEVGYCEKKAVEFVEKLGTWGWDCAAKSDEKVPAETEKPAEPK